MKAQKIQSYIFKIPMIFLAPIRFTTEENLPSLPSHFRSNESDNKAKNASQSVWCFWWQKSLEVWLALHHHSACLWASVSPLFSSPVSTSSSLPQVLSLEHIFICDISSPPFNYIHLNPDKATHAPTIVTELSISSDQIRRGEWFSSYFTKGESED